MKALSVQQPWAHLIVSGAKTIENRTWNTSHRGPLLIQTGYVRNPLGHAYAEAQGIELPEELPRGIVGVVNLVDTHRDTGCCRPWGMSSSPGQRATWHWELADAQPLPNPVAHAGRLMLFEPGTEACAILAPTVARVGRIFERHQTTTMAPAGALTHQEEHA